jgi:GDP-D-mannose dehydratase
MGSINKLVIGPNSQLGRYSPTKNTVFSSAKNFTTPEGSFEEIYFFFCEQRTFLDLTEKDFVDVNVSLTLKILETLYNEKARFYLYGTCELWNNCSGGITINTPYNYNYSPYVKSKEILTEKLNNFRRDKINNIFLLHPFNFNTPYRTKGFLFSKIFDSLINNTVIQTGNLNFFRDLVHPNFILQRSFNVLADDLIGSGHLINIRDFVHQLYKAFDMDINKHLIEDVTIQPRHQSSFYHQTDIKYNTLLEDTVNDIKKLKH